MQISTREGQLLYSNLLTVLIVPGHAFIAVLPGQSDNLLSAGVIL